MKQCPQCSSHYPDDLAFCLEDGADLQLLPPAVPGSPGFTSFETSPYDAPFEQPASLRLAHLPPQQAAPIVEQIKAGRSIEAIKLLRQAVPHLGLKEAKNIVGGV